MIVVGQRWRPKGMPAEVVFNVVYISRGVVELVRPTKDGKIYETVKSATLLEQWERVERR